jgi:hypothetical protein
LIEATPEEVNIATGIPEARATMKMLAAKVVGKK